MLPINYSINILIHSFLLPAFVSGY